MAKLKKVVVFKIDDAASVKAALASIEKFCGSGVPEGEAELTLTFEAPSIRVARARKGDDAEEDVEAVGST